MRTGRPRQTGSPRSIAPAVLVALLLGLPACPGETNGNGGRDSGGGNGKTVTVSGRVVDFESCMTKGGCQGVGDMKVALFFDTAVVSGRTAPNGAFTLTNVPNGVRTYLLVTDASGNSRYLSTLQAEPVTTRGKAVFSFEAFAIKATGSLYRSIGDEIGPTVDTHGIYVGQVLDKADNTFKASAGATVIVAPTVTVRYVKSNLDLDPTATEAFYPASQKSTGIFGQFVVLGDSAPQDYAIIADATTKTFTPAYVPIGSGYITVGLHRGHPKKGVPALDAGAPDAGK